MAENTTPSTSLPLTSLTSIIFTTGPFLFIWSLLRQYTTRSGPITLIPTLATINSRVYAVFSALLSYLLIQSYLKSYATSPDQTVLVDLPFNIPILNRSTFSMSELGLLYHYSKIYEYIDVLFLVAQGKIIGQHMAFHHITTPFLTHFRVLNCSSDDWRVFALANAVHHILIYSYFGGIGTSWIKEVSRFTQVLQLAAGIGTDVWWLYTTKGGKELEMLGSDMKPGEARNRGIAILLLARYAMLWWEEERHGRARMTHEERERIRHAQIQQPGDKAESKKQQ